MRFKVPSAPPGKTPGRLDTIIADQAGITRSRAKRLIGQGRVFIDGRPPGKAGERPAEGAVVEVEIPEPETAPGLVAEPVALDVRYMDDYLAVVEKPAGMVVYPAAGHAKGTLLNALLHRTGGRRAGAGAPLRPGVVHRLDKDTTGLMVIALEDSAYYGLAAQFRSRSIKREYAALVWGVPRGEEGVISAKIGRSRADRKKMSTSARRGKEAVTSWRVAERFPAAAGFPAASLVMARLGTGRTHQIRVHFASAGHPVLGDRTYGGKTKLVIGGQVIPVPRQMLHARLLGFVHPATGETMEFESPLPPDMETVLEKLRQYPGKQAGR
ncbi:MAG: RluA family pseudouridine synthase [Nitrospiraceae bacterium]|nr:RluA family pseudouridine synthase [Nitrospiraceae bacterium]